MSPGAFSAHSDLGLQPERTSLAWSRTLMSFVIVAALFLRWAPTQGAVVVVLTGGAALVALGIGATQHHHYARGARAIARESSPAALVPVAALGTAVVLLGAAGLAVIAL